MRNGAQMHLRKKWRCLVVFSKSKPPLTLPASLTPSLSPSLWLGPPPIPHSLQLLTSRHACVNAPCFDRELFFHLDHNGIIRLREIPCLRGFLDLIWKKKEKEVPHLFFLWILFLPWEKWNSAFNCGTLWKTESSGVSFHVHKTEALSCRLCYL